MNLVPFSKYWRENHSSFFAGCKDNKLNTKQTLWVRDQIKRVYLEAQLEVINDNIS